LKLVVYSHENANEGAIMAVIVW